MMGGPNQMTSFMFILIQLTVIPNTHRAYWQRFRRHKSKICLQFVNYT